MTLSAAVGLSGLPGSQVAPLQAVGMSLVIFLCTIPRPALSMEPVGYPGLLHSWVPAPGVVVVGQQDHFLGLLQLFPCPPLLSLFTTLPLTPVLSFDLANPGPWRNQTV